MARKTCPTLIRITRPTSRTPIPATRPEGAARRLLTELRHLLEGSRDAYFAGVEIHPSYYPYSISRGTEAVALAVQPDGRIRVAGSVFDLVNGMRGGVVRLNGDGFQLLPPRQGPDGVLRVTLTGQPGGHHTLEASTDLVHWSAVGTRSATGYALEFGDTHGLDFSHRFYRAQQQAGVTTPDRPSGSNP